MNQGKLIHLGPHFPTFIRHGSATNPDKVFTNKHCYHNTLIEPGNVTSSDHIPIILKISSRPFYTKQHETYQYNKADWQYFRDTLDINTQVNTLNNSTPEQIEEEINKWLDNVKDAMNKSIPKSSFKKIYQTRITPQIRALETAFNQLNSNAHTNGWNINNYREYVRIRQELRDECKREYNRRWEDSIDNTIQLSKDTKAFWSRIKQLQGSNTKHTNYLEDTNGHKYYTDEDKCTIMKNTWTDIFRITDEEEANFDAIHSQHIDTYIGTQIHRTTPHNTSDAARLTTDSFYSRPIQSEEIQKHIKRMKHKAPGTTKINKKVLEKCPEKSIEQLCNIFNAAFSSGFFPNAFKTAIIKLIPKENKAPKNPINYRPISLLEVPGKIYEKIILGRLNAFLIDNNVIKERQHGFRPKKGTSTAIATSYEIIANALSDKHQAIVVLRDVAKAFDKVWHNGLKYKLLRLGLPPLIEKTLCTFLDNRKAKISIGNKFSSEINLMSGVPQGSIISPTLYTLYTNDLPEAGPGTTDIMYADDITQIITTQSRSKHMMKLRVEREVERINRFEKKNGK